ncbi:unnamed protein product [Periconia digitata]|uniref:CFEM domain-containing protein n=1 Tax=Periconia digitata TaxID=1303443 RepID=A0A9W4UB41_9PLEO|nr:unnamed protein product [Periconia digitata]
MKLLLSILFLVFAHLSFAQSENGTDVLQLAIEKLPECALKCTLTTVGASTCQLTDIECIKHNEQLLDTLTVCVKSSCRIRDALTARKFLQELMGAPVRDETKSGTLTTLTVGGVALLAFILRVFARLPVFGRTWGPDDWVMTATIIIVIPLTICAYLLNELGLGKDMYVVPFDNITKILEIFYVTELLYLTSISLTKISMLLFYLRIFPDKRLRRIIYFTIALCVMYLIAFVTATALQCIPIRIAWEHWDGEHHGKCINLNADAWASAGVNIVLDIIVMALPMKQLKNLTMSPLRKLAVMVMFLGGSFITIVSILRLKYMVQFAHTENVTWDYLPIGYWSAIESHVGVIVACLPAIRSLETSLRKRLFPKTPGGSNSYYGSNTRASGRKSGLKGSKSRTWPSKAGASRQSTLIASKIDTDEFVRLHEYEMTAGMGDKSNENDSLGPRARAMSPNGDRTPLVTASSPQALSSILVRTEYSVDTETLRLGRIYESTSEEELMSRAKLRT